LRLWAANKPADPEIAISCYVSRIFQGYGYLKLPAPTIITRRGFVSFVILGAAFSVRGRPKKLRRNSNTNILKRNEIIEMDVVGRFSDWIDSPPMEKHNWGNITNENFAHTGQMREGVSDNVYSLAPADRSCSTVRVL